jgi:hypothetical protein
MLQSMPRSPGPKTSAKPKTSARFQKEAVRQVATLSELLARSLEHLPEPVGSATEIQRATGLDMKLSWKIHRVISAPSALAAAPYIPGAANRKTFVETMSRLGAPADALDSFIHAGLRFDAFVTEHAGDRRTFDSMVSGFAGSENEQKASERQRKAAFHANSHIWGVQADTLAMTMIQRPDPKDPTRIEEIGLRAEYGVRRLRPTPMPLYEQSYSLLGKRGQDLTAGRRRPLTGTLGEVGLIPQFCSDPLPPVEVRQAEGGWAHAVVMHTELGIKASVDLAMGFHVSGVSPRYRGEETHGWAMAGITKPFRSLVIDWVVQDDTMPASPKPFGFVSARSVRNAPPQTLWSGAQLSEVEPVRRLGRGVEALGLKGGPTYPDLVHWAISQAGWDPDRFETWRLSMAYPIVQSTVGLVYEMQPPPA